MAEDLKVFTRPLVFFKASQPNSINGSLPHTETAHESTFWQVLGQRWSFQDASLASEETLHSRPALG